jgi:hypothetical protein
MSQRIRKIIKLSQSINQYAVSPPVSSKTGNNKVDIGPCRVAMSLSYPYQLKVVTDFVLHNLIQPKEKLILVDDLEWNYTELIQGNSEKSHRLAPYYLQHSEAPITHLSSLR